MALARFALLKNLQKKANPCILLPQGLNSIASDGALTRTLAAVQNRSMGTQASQEPPKVSSEDKEVAVQEGGRGRKFSLFPRRNRRRSLWRSQDRDFSPPPPPLPDLFPTGLAHALMQASENINRLFENINNTSPFQLSGRIKEKDEHYNLKYNVPGLSKENLKVTVHDGLLEIRGQHKEEHNDEDDEYWSESNYYNTSLLLPDDAKADEIKAELKDGVLTVVIPRTEKPNKDVKEVEIH